MPCRALILAAFAFSLQATEIDSYTSRIPEFGDGLKEMNRIMNQHIVTAIEAANDEGACDDLRLREILRQSLGGYFWTQFENEVIESPLIDTRLNKVSESVYRDFTFFESFVLQMVSLGALTRVGDFYVGTDKFGHFIEEGYNYFNILHRDGGTIEQALELGETGEREHFGLQTTGVYSYGDLTADYDGLLFWEHLVGEIAPGFREPYVICQNDQFEQHRSFNWNTYINAAWDEGMNCNAYKTPEMEEKVLQRVTELEQERSVRLTCPIEPEQCRTMIERYGNVAKRLITPKCF